MKSVLSHKASYRLRGSLTARAGNPDFDLICRRDFDLRLPLMSFEKAKVLFYFDRISIMDEYENRNGRAKLGQSFRHLGCAWRGRTRVSSLDLFDGRFFLPLTVS